MKIGVLISGGGTNLQSIVDRCESGGLNASVACVISNKKSAFGLTRAQKHGIPAHFVGSKGYETREDHEKAIVAILKEAGVELVVLAGYMRLITPYFIGEFVNRIINIHPSLLPKYPGMRGYEEAWEAGDSVAGCTVHFVDAGMDTGPILLQKEFAREEEDTFETFKARGLSVEHEAFPEAIQLIVEKRVHDEEGGITVVDGKVVVRG